MMFPFAPVGDVLAKNIASIYEDVKGTMPFHLMASRSVLKQAWKLTVTYSIFWCKSLVQWDASEGCSHLLMNSQHVLHKIIASSL